MFTNQFPYSGGFNGNYGYAPQYVPTIQYPQPTQQNPAQQSQSIMSQPQQQQVFPATSNIEYVNGIEGAKALIIPPNSTRLVLDSDSKTFYIKTTDASGKPIVKAYPYIDPDEKEEKKETITFATIEQFNTLSGELKSLKSEINALKSVRKSNSEGGGKRE